jgi:hypothetical protein
MEGAALAEGAFDFDEAAGFFGDALDDGQAQAGAFAAGLGGEEGLEDAGQEVRGDAGAGVAHGAAGEGVPGGRLMASGLVRS